MKAKAPARTGGKLTIGFGLVSVPIDVFNGVDDEQGKIKRNMMSPAGNPVSFKKMDAETGEMLEQAQIKMVYTTDDGAKVELTDDEIAAAMGEQNGKCELLGFYPVEQMDRYVVASVMQVRPQSVTVGKKKTFPYTKPFALLMEGMEAKGVFGLLRYTLRGKPRLGALHYDGTMSVLYWEDEVRESLPMPEADLSEGEVAMAVTLIEALLKDEAPVLVNDAAQKVRDYAEAKAAGQPMEVKAAAPATDTVDLMAALQASVEAAKAAKAS